MRHASLGRCRTAALALGAAVALALGTAPAAAQQPSAPAGRCNLAFEPLNPASPPALTSFTLPSGRREIYQGGGIRYICVGQSITLEADSTIYNEDSQILTLIGNVRYREPRATVNANRMTYYQTEEWLIAEGNVLATLPSGSTLEGPYVEYYRAVPRVRTAPRTVATGRPLLRLVERDSAGAPQPPAVVRANRIVTENDEVVYASGAVDITRQDVRATGDSAYLDQTREFARLMRNPVVSGTGERPFTLRGREIDFFTRQRALSRVLAKREGRVVSDDLTLTADSIDLRIVDQELEEAFAFGPGRSRARSNTQDVIADSITARLPGGTLQDVVAIGEAYAEGVPDSTQVRSSERDWVRGDTVVARFDPPAATDTTGNPVVRELVASGSARSLYQFPSSGTCVDRPAVNYVRGRELVVSFAGGEVQSVTVTQTDDPVSGVYLEPQPDPACLERQRPNEAAPPAARPPRSLPPPVRREEVRS